MLGCSCSLHWRFRKTILNSKCVSPSSKNGGLADNVDVFTFISCFPGYFLEYSKRGKSALLIHSQLIELWMCDGAFHRHHTILWAVRQSHCLNHQKCSLQRSHFCRFIKTKKWLCLVWVDWRRAYRGFWLNLMHKLGICRNLIVVLLRAFLIVPPQVQKRDKRIKTLWFFPLLDYFFLSWTDLPRSGKGLCCVGHNLEQEGGCASGIVPLQPQKSMGFPQLPADPQGGSSRGISTACIPQVCAASRGNQTQ